VSALAPVTLAGWNITLAPLAMEHAPGLLAAVRDGDIWKLAVTTAPEPEPARVEAYIAKALKGQAEGRMLPFTVMDGDRIVGTSRYYEIEPDVPNLAIGYTWYAASVQRTHVNTTCKRLLLGHAFDTLGMRAVYFHTSHLNLASRSAIERLGAKLDGVLRNHKVHKDGSLRDTWSYSILDSEWPAVRDRLEARLAG